MKRTLTAALALMLMAPPALAMTWQEANRKSVELMEAGKHRDAADIAEKAADLYAGTNPNYRPEGHAQLLLNAADMLANAVPPKDVIPVLRRYTDKVEARAGKDTPALIPLVRATAVMQARAGEFSDARLLYDRVVAMAENAQGTGSSAHVQALVDASNHARIAMGTLDGKRYLETARRATANLPADDAVRLWVDLELAKIDLESAKWQEAEDGYTALLRRLEGTTDPVKQNLLRNVYGQLGFLYGARGRGEEVEKLIQASARLPYPEGNPVPLIGAKAEPPPYAREWGAEGSATFTFAVGPDGRVRDPRLVSFTGNPQFQHNALKALRDWRYQPKLVDGKAVEVPEVTAVLTYTIADEQARTGSRVRETR